MQTNLDAYLFMREEKLLLIKDVRKKVEAPKGKDAIIPERKEESSRISLQERRYGICQKDAESSKANHHFKNG